MLGCRVDTRCVHSDVMQLRIASVSRDSRLHVVGIHGEDDGEEAEGTGDFPGHRMSGTFNHILHSGIEAELPTPCHQQTEGGGDNLLCTLGGLGLPSLCVFELGNADDTYGSSAGHCNGKHHSSFDCLAREQGLHELPFSPVEPSPCDIHCSNCSEECPDAFLCVVVFVLRFSGLLCEVRCEKRGNDQGDNGINEHGRALIGSVVKLGVIVDRVMSCEQISDKHCENN